MKNIIKSLVVIVGVAVVVATGTGAFLSDIEVSKSNSFTAGALDLKVDNESYYNGRVSEATTFGPSDLDNGLLFLDFRDLKPDDEGEDTISLHVNNNDAWLCMDMALTSNDDASSTEPELEFDELDIPDNTWDGELADNVQMIWWVDDGDNVLENDEALLNGGVQTITELFGQDRTFTADLADATTNVWTGVPGPAIGGEVYYIGKAWCFGDMILDPVTQGDYTSPLDAQGGGFVCDGKHLNNETQTDSLTMNIAFRVIQHRHNPAYTCEEESRMGGITVTKQLIKDNGGNEEISDFLLYLKDTSNNIFTVTSGDYNVLPEGVYKVDEFGSDGYERIYNGPDCASDGYVTIVAGEDKACTIVNNDIAPHIRLIKDVTNDDGGILNALNFTLTLDGVGISQGSSEPVMANQPIAISEILEDGYAFVAIEDHPSNETPCPTSLGGTVELDEGEDLTCYIYNDDLPTVTPRP